MTAPLWKPFALACLGLALLAAPGVAPGSAGASVSSPTAPAAEGGHLKPFAAGSVQIDPASVIAGRVTVAVDPVPDLVAPTVTVTGTGDTAVTGEPTEAVGPDPSTTSAGIAVVEGEQAAADPVDAVLADATGTTLVATLAGTHSDGTPWASTDTVWVDRFEGTTLVSESGEQDLRLQRLDVAIERGLLDLSEADAVREQILGSTTSAESVTPGSCVDLCVSGTVLWTDSEGGTHPVDRAPVQVRDQDAGQDPVVATVTTDAAGHFDATINNVDAEGGARDVYVRVLADGPGFTIPQHIDSAVNADVPTGSTVTADLTANNTLDNNTAFAIHASLVFAGDEIVLQNGQLFQTVPVVFPDPDGSFYDGTSLHILALDRWDWDVSLHEYGHFVADQLNIEANPGGQHSGSDNLSDSRGSKTIGLPLAWGEGWPTFYAVSTLHERAAAAGIPNVGDTVYQDTEDQVVTDDLEVNARLGEDNERTNMNILWDLYDSVDDGLDSVGLGNTVMWDTIDGGDPHVLTDVYRLFGGSGNEQTSCIFSQMNVSPKIRQSTVLDEASRTVRWLRGNGGSHRNDSFTVTFRDGDGALLFRSRTVNQTSLTPGPAKWAAIMAATAGSALQVQVVGRQTDAPRSGPYRSCTATFPQPA